MKRIAGVSISLVAGIVCTSFFNFENSAVFLTKSSHIHFISEAPLEDIEADNNAVGGVLDVSKKTVAFKVPISMFVGFNSALQHEHFNENYMEIDHYPTATFNGKIIEDFDFSSPGTHKVRAKGMLNIHGVEKERIISGLVKISPASITISADFEIPLVDHDIKIPKVVNQKIAEIIKVSLKSELKPQ